MSNTITIGVQLDSSEVQEQIIVIEKQAKQSGEQVAENISQPIEKNTLKTLTKVAAATAAIGGVGYVAFTQFKQPAEAATAAFTGLAGSLSGVLSKLTEANSTVGETKDTMVSIFKPIFDLGVGLFKITAPLTAVTKGISLFLNNIDSLNKGVGAVVPVVGAFIGELAKVVDTENKLRSAIKDLASDIKNVKEKFNDQINTSKKFASGFIEIAEVTNKTGLRMAILAASLIGVGVAFAAVGAAFKASVDIVVFAEDLRKVQEQFNLFATRAGVDAAALENALRSTAKGTVDFTDVLRSSSKALLELGVQSNKLPQLLDIAKKSASVFGGTAVESFDKLIHAIVTANTKTLQQVGIFLNAEETLKRYAKAHGGSVEMLTQQARQQAVLEAVLRKGQTAFEGVNTSVSKNQESLKRLTITVNDLKESLSLAFEKTLGGATNRALEGLNTIVKNISDNLILKFGDASDAARVKISRLNEQIESLRSQMSETMKSSGGFVGFFNKDLAEKAKLQITSYYGGQIAELVLQRDKLEKELGVKPRLPAGAGAGGTDSPTIFNPEDLQRQALAFRQTLLQLNQDRIDQQAQTAITLEQHERMFIEKQIALAQDFQNKKDQFERDFKNKAFVDEQAYREGLLNLEKSYTARQIQLINQRNSVITETTKIARSALVNGLVSAFSALGAAMVKSKNGFEAFGKAVLSSLGGLAIQIGQFLLLMGLGFQSAGLVLPTFLPAGAGAIAAGLGLIALGGALQALGGGGEDIGGGVATAGGGGGFGGGQVENPDLAARPDIDRQPGTVVNLTVQGNIMDRRQAGLELVEVLNEAFGSSGLVVQGAV